MWGARRPLAALLALAVLSGCSSSEPDPTPYPTAVPRQPVEEAPAAADAFLGAWRLGRYPDMYQMVTATDRQRLSEASFVDLLSNFQRLTGVNDVSWQLGEPQQVVLPAAPRPPDQAAPTPTPRASPNFSAATPSPTPQPTVSATPVPADTPLAGPVSALLIPVELIFTTDVFGDVALSPDLVLTPASSGWQIHWNAAMLFPELGPNGTLRLHRQEPTRGQIVAQDGTVFARTRRDGARIYPQDWLAGQTIGYATPATRKDLRGRYSQGLRPGDLVGRSGLEAGADVLLAGSPGFTLVAAPAAAPKAAVLHHEMVPGADVVITLRRSIQATADAAIASYAEAGTAVIDPRTGDVWALASAPLFNPNAMTIGTTLAGVPLGTPSEATRLNHAVLAAYPTGSSFKVFTLAAALKTGVASSATRMPCDGTWTFSGFTFHNYMDHHLAGLVDLLQAMAFSCNTTYMPLSIRVYDRDQQALTDLVHEFGFGQSTGMRYLADEPGVLPDAGYFEDHKRWDGKYHPYGPFDQIQLAIGQGSFLGTPLQMANAYAAIGNGGTLWTPRLVVEARLPDGTAVERNKRRVAQRISVSRGQLAYVVESMKAVVNYSYGTAYGAFLGFGLQVAGKSGTAETGTPTPDAWFPAIAPAGDPRIAAATVLVHVPLATGGSDAAPLIRRVFAAYFGGG
ncbi:MAG: penicillin-binding transpeptidase domain-containing protein [Chloroflexota bacterium]